MDKLPAGAILVDAAHYGELVEELTLLRLRCEKQTALIETLKKELTAPESARQRPGPSPAAETPGRPKRKLSHPHCRAEREECQDGSEDHPV